MSPNDPPPLTARHHVAAHLASAVDLLAEAYEEAHDAAEPCARPVRIVIHSAHLAAMHALDVLRASYYLDGATPPEAIGTAGRAYDEAAPLPRSSCPPGCQAEGAHAHIDLSVLRQAAEEMATTARPVAGAKLRAVADTPAARAVGRASVYAGSSPLAPFRQAIDREMAVARERLEAEVLGRPPSPGPALWFRPLPRLASWTARRADRIDWPRCVPGYARWRRLRARLGGFLHNVVAHPLMGVGYAVEDAGDAMATAGEWLHDHTEPEQGEAHVDVEADTGPLEQAMADTKVAVSRFGLGPERAAQVRDQTLHINVPVHRLEDLPGLLAARVQRDRLDQG